MDRLGIATLFATQWKRNNPWKSAHGTTTQFTGHPVADRLARKGSRRATVGSPEVEAAAQAAEQSAWDNGSNKGPNDADKMTSRSSAVTLAAQGLTFSGATAAVSYAAVIGLALVNPSKYGNYGPWESALKAIKLTGKSSYSLKHASGVAAISTILTASAVYLNPDMETKTVSVLAATSAAAQVVAILVGQAAIAKKNAALVIVNDGGVNFANLIPAFIGLLGDLDFTVISSWSASDVLVSLFGGLTSVSLRILFSALPIIANASKGSLSTLMPAVAMPASLVILSMALQPITIPFIALKAYQFIKSQGDQVKATGWMATVEQIGSFFGMIANYAQKTFSAGITVELLLKIFTAIKTAIASLTSFENIYTAIMSATLGPTGIAASIAIGVITAVVEGRMLAYLRARIEEEREAAAVDSQRIMFTSLAKITTSLHQAATVCRAAVAEPIFTLVPQNVKPGGNKGSVTTLTKKATTVQIERFDALVHRMGRVVAILEKTSEDVTSFFGVFTQGERFTTLQIYEVLRQLVFPCAITQQLCADILSLITPSLVGWIKKETILKGKDGADSAFALKQWLSAIKAFTAIQSVSTDIMAGLIRITPGKEKLHRLLTPTDTTDATLPAVKVGRYARMYGFSIANWLRWGEHDGTAQYTALFFGQSALVESGIVTANEIRVVARSLPSQGHLSTDTTNLLRIKVLTSLLPPLYVATAIAIRNSHFISRQPEEVKSATQYFNAMLTGRTLDASQTKEYLKIEDGILGAHKLHAVYYGAGNSLSATHQTFIKEWMRLGSPPPLDSLDVRVNDYLHVEHFALKSLIGISPSVRRASTEPEFADNALAAGRDIAALYTTADLPEPLKSPSEGLAKSIAAMRDHYTGYVTTQALPPGGLKDPQLLRAQEANKEGETQIPPAPKQGSTSFAVSMDEFLQAPTLP